MNRRGFLKCSGACAGAGVTGFSLAGSAATGQQAPHQKVIDPNGLTTEFIRCPDPSRVVVAKISRRRV